MPRPRLCRLLRLLFTLYRQRITPLLTLRGAIAPKRAHDVIAPQQAVDLVSEHVGVAILTQPTATDLHADGVVVKPLSDAPLSLKTRVIVRAANTSWLVEEYVRMFLRKICAPSACHPKRIVSASPSRQLEKGNRSVAPLTAQRRRCTTPPAPLYLSSICVRYASKGASRRGQYVPETQRCRNFTFQTHPADNANLAKVERVIFMKRKRTTAPSPDLLQRGRRLRYQYASRCVSRTASLTGLTNIWISRRLVV
jgi:hypothetical protein